MERRRRMGVNISDATQDFTGAILAGLKTVETRGTQSLRPYVGRRIGIVRTGVGPAELVGWATVGEPVHYETPAEFAADYRRHLVAPGSGFDCGPGGRYGYPLTDVVACKPRRVRTLGIVARRV
jgi:hypothetical protein